MLGNWQVANQREGYLVRWSRSLSNLPAEGEVRRGKYGGPQGSLLQIKKVAKIKSCCKFKIK